MKLLKIINSPRAIKWNADCVFKVDNDVILYEVKTSYFLHVAVGNLNIPAYKHLL